MNSHIAVSNLPLPDDCVYIIKSYAYVDETTYHSILFRKSICALLKNASSPYQFELDGYAMDKYRWTFRWFQYSKYQFQTVFCIYCGNYMDVTYGKLPDCCRCKCFV